MEATEKILEIWMRKYDPALQNTQGYESFVEKMLSVGEEEGLPTESIPIKVEIKEPEKDGEKWLVRGFKGKDSLFVFLFDEDEKEVFLAKEECRVKLDGRLVRLTWQEGEVGFFRGD